MKSKIVETIHSQYSTHMLDALFDRPIEDTIFYLCIGRNIAKRNNVDMRTLDRAML